METIGLESQEPVPVLSHCSLFYEFCSGWIWSGCCSTGKKRLLNQCIRYWKCGTDPLYKDTLISYQCGTANC